MPNCMICKRPAHSGYVLCSNCAESLESDSLPPELAFVLDQLAEEIVSNTDIYACSMCEGEQCSSQTSGLVCCTGVKNWLTDKASEYLTRLSGRGLV